MYIVNITLQPTFKSSTVIASSPAASRQRLPPLEIPHEVKVTLRLTVSQSVCLGVETLLLLMIPC
jgi:hypothetical protein